MPGLKLRTKHEARTCLKLAWRTAQNLGYSLTPIDDASKRFTATKGNVLVSLLGGLFPPRCDFQISIESYSDANELVLERNTPQLTGGAMGVSRVHQRAEELLDAIASDIEGDGGTILEKRKF